MGITPSLSLFVPNARVSRSAISRTSLLHRRQDSESWNLSSRVNVNSATGFVLSGERSGTKGAARLFCSSVVNESIKDAFVNGLLGLWPQKSQLGRRESWSLPAWSHKLDGAYEKRKRKRRGRRRLDGLRQTGFIGIK